MLLDAMFKTCSRCCTCNNELGNALWGCFATLKHKPQTTNPHLCNAHQSSWFLEPDHLAFRDALDPIAAQSLRLILLKTCRDVASKQSSDFSRCVCPIHLHLCVPRSHREQAHCASSMCISFEIVNSFHDVINFKSALCPKMCEVSLFPWVAVFACRPPRTQLRRLRMRRRKVAHSSIAVSLITAQTARKIKKERDFKHCCDRHEQRCLPTY